MSFEIIKFLIAHTPNWATGFFLTLLVINLFIPLREIFTKIIENQLKQPQKKSITEQRKDAEQEEYEARVRFYEHTGIFCNKNLRDGLKWLFNNNRSQFKWKFIKTAVRYLREEKGRFYVKVPWIEVAFERLFYAFAIYYLLMFFACLYFYFKFFQQLSQSSLLTMILVVLVFLLFFSLSFLRATFPVYAVRIIAKEVKKLDTNPDNNSEIPKLFDPIYGTEHSLVKQNDIEKIKSFLNHVKRLRELSSKH